MNESWGKWWNSPLMIWEQLNYLREKGKKYRWSLISCHTPKYNLDGLKYKNKKVKNLKNKSVSINVSKHNINSQKRKGF